jgi:hypothetical protein
MSCHILDKCCRPKYANIKMICMPHFHSKIFMIWKFEVINNQIEIQVLKISFCPLESQYLSYKIKNYLLKIILKNTRGLFNKKEIIFGISPFGAFWMIIYIKSCNLGTSYKFTLGLNVIPCYQFLCFSCCVFSPCLIVCC